MTDVIREAFEAWFANEIDADPDALAFEECGNYFNSDASMAWHVWQAALQSVQGEVIGYLTNQAVARLQSDEKLNGEHLYAFKPDDMSKFHEVYLRTCTETTAPVAYAVFEDSGNIRIWSANNDQVDDLRARFGRRLRPLYTAPTVKESLTAHLEPIGYADPDTLTDYRAGERLHIPVYRPDASAEWQSGIPVYLHPAPPSVAVPEGFCLERGHRLHYARTGEVCSCPKYIRHPHCDRAEMDDTLPIANPWLTTPQPDHSPDAGKVVPVAKYAANEIRSVLTGMIQWKDGEWAEHGPERLAAVAAKLDEIYTHPTPADDGREVVQGNPRALWDFANEVAQGKWNQYNRSHVAGIRAAAQFMDKHPPTPTTDGGEVEPAFWITKNDFERASNKTNLLCSITVRGEWEGLVPLYTHPAPQPVQSENEAKLVKESYDAGYSEAMIYARVCCGRLDNPENTTDYRDCARFLDLIFEGEINEVARLRASQQEGGER